MKGLGFFDKIVFIFTSIFAVLLLLACVVPNISIVYLPFLSVLGLVVPILVGANFLFFLYWLLKAKRQLFLPLFVLVLGYFTLGTFVKFNSSNNGDALSSLKIMSYNVRSFNKNEHINSATVFEDIKELIDTERPDVVCFQEVGYRRRKEYSDYPYQHLEYVGVHDRVLVGIFSKYPIVEAELMNFPKSYNNGAYADILYKKDTIRIYDLHLESLGVTPGSGLRNQPSDKLFRRVVRAFTKQREQAELVKKHSKAVDYKTIICGDLNNTQFSDVYKIIRGDRQDTFVEKGKGLGRTYDFLGIPFRIDFIFADDAFEVVQHKNFEVKYSDHFPIMASFRLKDN